jgi:hypothetical protein
VSRLPTRARRITWAMPAPYRQVRVASPATGEPQGPRELAAGARGPAALPGVKGPAALQGVKRGPGAAAPSPVRVAATALEWAAELARRIHRRAVAPAACTSHRETAVASHSRFWSCCSSPSLGVSDALADEQSARLRPCVNVPIPLPRRPDLPPRPQPAPPRLGYLRDRAPRQSQIEERPQRDSKVVKTMRERQ